MENITQYNREFLNIDTEEKAYFLGQIYGDGYNSGKSPYKVTIASIIDDIELYKRLQELFPFFKLKFYNSHSNIVYLENYYKEVSLDLAALGMISNKTEKDKTGEFHFPNLNSNLVRHFIRGYFDADGSCWYPTRLRSRNNIHIEFGCATKNFLLRLKEVLDQNDIHFTYKERKKRAGNGKFYISYEIYVCNYQDARKFADYIYKDATIYLKRKYDLCYKEKSLRPSAVEVFGNCPYCGSSNVVRMAVRGPSRRLRCKNCEKRYSRPLAEEKFLKKSGTLKRESEVKAESNDSASRNA